MSDPSHPVSRGAADPFPHSAEWDAAVAEDWVRYAQNAIDGGAITAEDGARWVARLTELAEVGSYLAGITYYVSVGVR